MANMKINVVQLLDHGWSPASTTSMSPVMVNAAVDAEPELLPVEAHERVMKSAKLVKVDRANLALSQAIIASQNPLEFATAMIAARYEALGGPGGFLGAANGAVTACADGVGFRREFKGGSIYWSPRTGAHEVHGLIRQRWLALGGERGFLRYPRTDELVGRDPQQEGRYNHFEGGSIFWHPASGAFEVHGAILGKYLELGAEASILGYPTTDETATPDRVGRFNHFQRGSIYWTPGTSAHEIHGLIRQYWAEKGWERNAELGYPITDELVPHRSIGQTPAPWLRKPLAELPADVFRLPDEQPPPDLQVVTLATTPVVKATTRRASATARVATTSSSVSAATASVRKAAGASTASASADLSKAATIKLGASDVLVAQPVVIRNPSILIIDHKGRSQDRYTDFENGVLFWRRATNAVTQLKPRTTAPGGDKLGWTAAEIVALVSAEVKRTLGTFPGATAGAGTFAGTTGYSFDGAGVRNRAHRVRIPLQGKRPSGSGTVNATAIIEVEAEVGFDPVDREVVWYPVRWNLVAHPGDFVGGGDLRRALHARLDPAIWKQHLITRIPGTTDDPVAVLSVKTLSDGRVACYLEP